MLSTLVFPDPVLSPNGTVNVTEGTDGSLSCSRTSDTNTNAISSTWTFGSTELISVDGNVLYSYTNIMRNQSGVYNCTLVHSIGSGGMPRYFATRSAAVTINVQCEFTN